MHNFAPAAMETPAEDPFDFILAEAGDISSSQEEVLRRSRFIGGPREPPVPSSSSSSSFSFSSGDGEGGGFGADAADSYRISVRPINMRSASDSDQSSSSLSSSPSSSSDADSDSGGEVVLEAEGRAEERRPDDGRDGEKRPELPIDGGHRLPGTSGEKQNWISKRKHSADMDEEEVDGAAEKNGFSAEARRKVSPVLSDESTEEPIEGQETPHLCGVCGGGVALDSHSPVAKRLTFSGSEKDAPVDKQFVQFRDVSPVAPPVSFSPPDLLKHAPPQRSPKPSTCGGALAVPEKPPSLDRSSANGEVIKRATFGSAEEIGKGTMGFRKLPPSFQSMADGGGDGDFSDRSDGLHGNRRPEDEWAPKAAPATCVQALNITQPQVERPLGTELGNLSLVEMAKPPESEQALANGLSGCSQGPSLSPSGKSVAEGAPVERMVPSYLVDAMLEFSEKPDKRLENVDFLEVLAMKGIHIPPPMWWRPGGYDLP